ncbi:MAG: hypothetical protein ACTS3F_04140 [Phycisphaerales bacterium]
MPVSSIIIRPLRPLLIALIAIVGAGAIIPAAEAQPRGRQALEFIDEINKAFGPRAGVESADALLFPAIVGMDPMPAALADLEIASLIVPGNPRWDEIEAWAEAPAQQAVIEALKTIADDDRRFQFTHPYNTEGVAPEFIDNGLYIDIEPLNLLVTARYEYLNRLDDVAILLTAEATRLAERGDAEEALEVLYAWVRLGRIVADRGMSLEKYWGFGTMLVAFERLRDVVYLYDFNFTIEHIAELLERLSDRSLRLDLIALPEGDRIAAKQLVARTMVDRGPVAVPQFTATMAFIESEGRELTIYDKAAFYRDIASAHAGFQRTNQKIDDVFGSWDQRWKILNPHDDLLKLPSDYMLMDRGEFYQLMVVLSDIEWLYTLRLVTAQDLYGTRTALGLAGYRARFREWPKNIAAISPNPLPRPGGEIPAWVDLFRYLPRFDRFMDLSFFVPIRDTPPPAIGDPEPHEITVIGGSLLELFSRGRPSDIGLAAAQLGSVSRVGVVDFAGSRAVSSTAIGSDAFANAEGLGGFGLMGLSPDSLPGFDALDLSEIEIPDDLFDLENLTINADSLRRFLVDATNAAPVTQSDREDFVAMLNDFSNEFGINPRNAGEEAPKAIRAALTEEPMRTILAQAGVQIPAISQALEGMARAAFSGQKMSEAITMAMDTGSVSPELLKEASVEAVNAAVRAEYIDPLVNAGVEALSKQLGGRDEVRSMFSQMQQALSMLATSGINQVTGTTLERFTAKIGQSQFILYSYGADAVNNQARQVGLGGNDILYWPPIISLKREHLERSGGL